jgi:hypothetical protein
VIGGNSLDQNEPFFVSNGGFNQTFVISYNADGGNDVVMVAIPEPGTIVSVFGGLGALLGLQRFRRRS